MLSIDIIKQLPDFALRIQFDIEQDVLILLVTSKAVMEEEAR